jgi:hypothetical protein
MNNGYPLRCQTGPDSPPSGRKCGPAGTAPGRVQSVRNRAAGRAMPGARRSRRTPGAGLRSWRPAGAPGTVSAAAARSFVTTSRDPASTAHRVSPGRVGPGRSVRALSRSAAPHIAGTRKKVARAMSCFTRPPLKGSGGAVPQRPRPLRTPTRGHTVQRSDPASGSNSRARTRVAAFPGPLPVPCRAGAGAGVGPRTRLSDACACSADYCPSMGGVRGGAGGARCGRCGVAPADPVCRTTMASAGADPVQAEAAGAYSGRHPAPVSEGR